MLIPYLHILYRDIAAPETTMQQQNRALSVFFKLETLRFSDTLCLYDRDRDLAGGF